MPSMPDPNSPYLASRLQADMGVRMPGTPTSAGQPGLKPADLSFPAPPAPAAAPVGRPPEATAPAPLTPPAPTPQAAQPGAQPPQAQPSAAASAPPPRAATSPAAGPPAAAPTPSAPPVLGTPAGVNDAGEEQFALSPEGDMRYRQAVVAKRAELGPMPKLFRHPSLPELPIELGKWNYNPMTGVFRR